MTDKQYVIRACQLKGLDLCKPTKADRGILVLLPNGRVLDGFKWSDIRTQLNAFYASGV